MSGRDRLDRVLEARGLVPSRARAADAIRRGVVTVNGIAAKKAGQPVTETDIIAISDPAEGYVSRAALKLIAGLDAAGFDPSGKVCLDLGASTGGFTQVLAQRGAKTIYAVDVGHGQLHPDVAALSNVVSLEGTNARDLDTTLIPEPIEMLVCDVSFVSLTKVISPPSSRCMIGAEAVLLIKPQFEVGRDFIGKGGIVIEGPHVEAAIEAVIGHMAQLGWTFVMRMPSPLTGGDGNTEHIAAFRRT
ncbi:TlyA family RNA methyltransferase [Pelagibacterium xiamenense]|uniref:TlyA family RNA methyltransferase n=1 Tax=Pelagibacterium xiamenense TaxID=2901140 RepID=UPI001E2FADE4|nr:TlyA family RNA methyltransferase [Pelagibacterium xiamenense]MCD7059329.1 TlyA family RNA methyltransferase [Pelagibacterium xiamenense]